MDELYRVTPDILDSEAEEYEDSVADILSDGSDIDAVAGITDDNEDELIAADDEELEEEDPDVVNAAQEVQALDVGEYADYDIQAVEDDELAEEESPEEDDDIPALLPDDDECEDGECDDDMPDIMEDEEEED